ncbi:MULTISPECIES: HdeD family acid-resistance protein [Nguyenibacter]|uniref:HdeD family acid-resistance protein n=1 Tax=Nguyenibacter vanlangensis TaxID=1216886 RepID=A0A7Y7IWY5_9PROT|nr:MULTISPECIES: HdeD family acid-resistance protein [Nguyenibacter]NVN11834.1 HdeD family acid-resistance protein [Nguyenibacter vanlangensis]WRH88440.1 HdeD family acid-resistance protein [Nguyenibacter sp. L1]
MATPFTQRWGLFVLLGAVSIALGIFAWIDAISVTLASTIVIGILLVVAGAVQLFHAFAVRDWGGFVLSMLGGVLYIVGGFLLMEEPVSGSIILTVFIAACLIISGTMRMVIAARHRDLNGWWIVLGGGLISLLVGVCLYLTLPWSGLWLIGTFIAVELIAAGIGWIQFGLALRTVA